MALKTAILLKSALAWLNKNKVEFEFYDYKKSAITEAKLKAWCKQVGWESLVNQRGTTWHQLEEVVQEKVVNERSAIALMMEKTSVIKRPLIERNGQVVLLGFDEAAYKHELK
jgi:arsenate reductase